MSALPSLHVTAADYLEEERRALEKHELVNGQVFAMSGASYRHNQISHNIGRRLGNLLDGRPCRTLGSDLRIKIDATGSYTYADVLVHCGPPLFDDDHHDTLLNPKVIVEVLSPSTEGYDRGAKFAHYRRIDSLEVYLLVAQDRAHVERYVRLEAGWTLSDVTGLDGAVVLDALGISLPMAEIYEGVDLTGPEVASPPGREPIQRS